MNKNDKIISLDKVKKQKREEEDRRRVDLSASIVILEECYKLLSFNNLPELRDLKRQIISMILRLEKISKEENERKK